LSLVVTPGRTSETNWWRSGDAILAVLQHEPSTLSSQRFAPSISARANASLWHDGNVYEMVNSEVR